MFSLRGKVARSFVTSAINSLVEDNRCREKGIFQGEQVSSTYPRSETDGGVSWELVVGSCQIERPAVSELAESSLHPSLALRVRLM